MYFMKSVIAIKDLRQHLAHIADLVEAGESFTVIRRSKPSFEINPINQEVQGRKSDLSDLVGMVSQGNLAQSIDSDLYE